jgi:hypothetical protein
VSPVTLRWVWALSSILIVLLVAVVASRSEGSAVRFVALPGLFFLIPMALFSVLALSVAPFLRSVAAATLVALSIASAGALVLAWRGAVYGEEGFVFGLYTAVSVLILVISFVVALRGRV